MKIESQASTLQLEVGPAIDSEESLRMTVEAHARESVGVVPAYEDVAFVVAIFLVFLVINALWSAQDGTWLGMVRKAFAGDRIEGLFLGIRLRAVSGDKVSKADIRTGYLTSWSKKRIEVYSEKAYRRGDFVTIESEDYGNLTARVQSCRSVFGSAPWYRIRLRLLSGKKIKRKDFGVRLRSATAGSAVIVAAAVSIAATESQQTIMTSLLEPMTKVLEVSFDRDEFSAVPNRPFVETQLARLVEGASRLEDHAKTREPGFEFVARSLGRDVRDALRAYKRGEYEDARRTLHNLTDNCIACHANLPEGRQLPPSERFFSTLRSKSLPPLAMAHYQMVSRQFDAALATFESIFTAPGVERTLLLLLGYFGDYLKISIGIKNDFQRPRRLLAILAERPETPMHLRGIFKTWITSLDAVASSKPFNDPTLARAKKLMEKGHNLMDSAADRAGLIYYITAESVLMRFLKAHSGVGLDTANANYLLGNAASLSEHSLWIMRAPFYYESAIRLAPEAPFALKAYAALQDRLYAEAVIEGRPLDYESLFLLDELNELIEDAQSRGRK